MSQIPIELLPKELGDSGRDLRDECGVNNVAWNRKNAMMVVECLDPKFAILGGDVYAMSAGQLSLTIDNWSCERGASEEDDVYIERSRARALQYLTSYQSPDNVDPWFTIVV
jgi:hypothetical protein